MKVINTNAAQTLLFMLTSSQLVESGQGLSIQESSQQSTLPFFKPSHDKHQLTKRDIRESNSGGLLIFFGVVMVLVFVCGSIYLRAKNDDDDDYDEYSEVEAEHSAYTESNATNESHSSSSTGSNDSSECAYLQRGNSAIDFDSAKTLSSDNDSSHLAIEISDNTALDGSSYIISVEDIESDNDSEENSDREKSLSI